MSECVRLQSFLFLSPLKYITKIYQKLIQLSFFNVLLESCCPPNLLQKHCDNRFMNVSTFADIPRTKMHSCSHQSHTCQHPQDVADWDNLPNGRCARTPRCFAQVWWKVSLFTCSHGFASTKRLTTEIDVSLIGNTIYTPEKGPVQRKIVFQATFCQWILGYVSFFCWEYYAAPKCYLQGGFSPSLPRYYQRVFRYNPYKWVEFYPHKCSYGPLLVTGIGPTLYVVNHHKRKQP